MAVLAIAVKRLDSLSHQFATSLLVRTCLRPNFITLSSSRAGSRAGLWAASELDSIMEFGLSGAI